MPISEPLCRAATKPLLKASAATGLAILLAAAAPPPAQTGPRPEPEPTHIFAPIDYPTAINRYRSADGTPGPDYWHNRADYRIDVALDAPTHRLTGQETITYRNNSPSTLNVLWLQLEQNIYRETSRGAAAMPARFKAHGHTEGMQIDRVALLDAHGKEIAVTPLISDTRMQISLPTPLAPASTVKFTVSWHYEIPGTWGGRTAVTPSRNGDIFEIAQFYPRMAVFDDLRGWDTAPYLGGEFYLDYGDIDYRVTVPSNFLVMGSGALLNEKDVLTAQERQRLEQARMSEKRVLIRNQADIEATSRISANGTRRWHFFMPNTRDVAFVASAALLWDAAKLDLPPVAPAPGLKPAPRLAMSVYPVEGIGPQAWDRSTEYVKHSIEYFSSSWYPYPWATAINVGGHGAGMEYPGIVFDGMQDRDAKLFWITTHELGHGWFPMIVGSNERRHGFMDEGFNTFIDSLASQHFNKGEFAPKQDGEYAPDTGKPADDIVKILKDPVYDPLMTSSTIPGHGNRHAMAYFKAAYGLELLRSQILGPERFDRAFRHYIAVWAYKHPTPSDFFRLMESDAGEDLSWFWRGWYFENRSPDYALDAIEYPDKDPKKGVSLTISNKGWLPLPVTLAVTRDDGSVERLVIPTEVWSGGNTHVVTLKGGSPVRRAILDPDHVIPDIDRSNDALSPVPRPSSPASSH
ncbi:M1 family metallopeptidase [Asaia bogorensis]|uniref:M1 family metallopeptidase n=1 Tax=Asaia bogorensis TaxID=91915 RepID=UPI0013CECC0D|nr:M1 family metallopeptidase [Asaia bogorensis]